MTANRIPRNDKAEVGVGTLIVFIAMVLVAAVAAGVLINTSGILQQRASSTGSKATQDVSSNLEVTGVYGYIASSKVDSLNVTMELAAGALALDLSKLVIRYSDGSSVTQFAYDATNDNPASATDYGSIAASKFGLNWIRSVDGSITGATSPEVMKPGDLVEFHMELPTDLDVRKGVEVTFAPEVGSPISADFTTPASFGSATYVTLR